MPTRVITSEQELRDLILLGVSGVYKDATPWPNSVERDWANGSPLYDVNYYNTIVRGLTALNYRLEIE